MSVMLVRHAVRVPDLTYLGEKNVKYSLQGQSDAAYSIALW